jgi:hypothetical protein
MASKVLINRADLCVEGGKEVVDEHMLLPQILLQQIHQLTRLQHNRQMF